MRVIKAMDYRNNGAGTGCARKIFFKIKREPRKAL